MRRKGLLIVLDGVDGSGTSTQLPLLTSHIKRLSKYQDVLETHEPWEDEEITRKLREDKTPYSDGRLMAKLYVNDRVEHTNEIILPVIQAGGIVLSDRYKMSTCAYQWSQGLDLFELLRMHENRGILTPDLTILLDVPLEVAQTRVRERILAENPDTLIEDKLEKFERDLKFVEKTIEAYRCLAQMSVVDPKIFGKVLTIDGSQSIEKVASEISTYFDGLYNDWRNS